MVILVYGKLYACKEFIESGSKKSNLTPEQKLDNQQMVMQLVGLGHGNVV